MKTIKLITTMVFTIAFLAACTSGEKETPQADTALSHSEVKRITLTTEQFNASGMKLGNVSSQLFSEHIQSTGMLDVPPQHKAGVSTYYGGVVRKMPLLVGQVVQKGATLFTLENPAFVQMQRDYLNAKSRLNYLKAEYDRQKKLLKEKVASRKNFLRAESEYLTVMTDYKALAKKLRLMNIDTEKLTFDNMTTFSEIKAPISGFITEVKITTGQYLSPNEAAVRIVNTDHMHLELNVFEKDITKIKKGQPIRFQLPENGSGYFMGEVFLVGRAVYSEDRTINVHGHIKDEKQNRRFIPGMYIEADILVDQVRRSALPSDAVVHLNKAYYILVQKSFKNNMYVFEQQEIKIGQSGDGYTEILNADVLGDKAVLIKGAFDMIQ